MSVPCFVLQVQNIINGVNEEVVGENERIMAVNCINQAIDSGNAENTMKALAAPTAKLQVGVRKVQVTMCAADVSSSVCFVIP